MPTWAAEGQGRSGGLRTIIFFRTQERAFFVFGFAKNELANISADDLRAFRRAAEVTFALDARRLRSLIEAAELIEVICDEEENIQERSDSSDT